MHLFPKNVFFIVENEKFIETKQSRPAKCSNEQAKHGTRRMKILVWVFLVNAILTHVRSHFLSVFRIKPFLPNLPQRKSRKIINIQVNSKKFQQLFALLNVC